VTSFALATRRVEQLSEKDSRLSFAMQLVSQGLAGRQAGIVVDGQLLDPGATRNHRIAKIACLKQPNGRVSARFLRREVWCPVNPDRSSTVSSRTNQRGGVYGTRGDAVPLSRLSARRNPHAGALRLFVTPQRVRACPRRHQNDHHSTCAVTRKASVHPPTCSFEG
jgi:hypothetical protein